MFKRISGKPHIEWYPKKASTAFANGGLTYWDGSGAIQPADATSGDHAGVILRAVTSADSDYATTDKVPVDVPQSNDVFEVDVETGTATAALIGTYVDLVADGDAADVSASSKDALLVVGFISASKILVKINSMAYNLRVATT
jgi:hypothetical protein